MFYNTKENNHHLKYNPFKACIVPRPIGWISSVDSNGVVNLAPYSYFNAVCDIPPIIMFSSAYKSLDNKDSKDSLRNIESSKEFVVNIATYDLRDVMNNSSTPLPYGISEVEEYNIETSKAHIVKAPYVTKSPINLECKYIKTEHLIVDGKKTSSQIIFGHVIGINIRDDIITEGKIDIHKLLPICRLGYNEYAVIREIFSMNNTKGLSKNNL